MSPWNMLIRVVLLVEDAIVSQILRSPRFHHGVRRIHRTVEDFRHGRNPSDPLRPGEATENQNSPSRSFLGLFIDELRSQLRGSSKNPPPPSPPKK